VGKKKSLTALETVTKMIVISDNTATNMIIQRLGGQAIVNQRFQSWGLTQTHLKNPLPDLAGTNQTSARDLVRVLFKVNQGEILSLKSRDRLLGIMEATKTKSLLPQGLEAGAIIAHKTGDIGTVLGDAGIVDMPTGKRYIGAVLATRPYNDLAARTLIQEISRTVYQHFKGTTPAPKPQTAKAAQPTTSPSAPKVRKTPSADSTPQTNP
jgi:beta-lactamase class A